MTKIAIIGAGPLGRWLALQAARAGFQVSLEDVMPTNLHHAQEFIREQFSPEAAPAVHFASTIEDAVREAELVIDCVPDELESKLEILWLLDRMAPPRTIFATPTVRQSIVDLAACTYRPEKCVALVTEAKGLAELASREIVVRTTPRTAAETVAVVEEFWRKLGFTPKFECEPQNKRKNSPA